MKVFLVGVITTLVVGGSGWVVYDRFISSDSGTETTPTQPVNEREGTAVIDLRNKGLTKVGADIYNQTDTVELILSGNNLTSLPSEMGKMTKLEVLKLDHNRLEGSLIAEIRKMPLRVLDASFNNMTGMPAEIGQLTKLEKLDYSHNQITNLPNELANLRNNLKELNLSGNPLSPETISKLKADLPNTTITY